MKSSLEDIISDLTNEINLASIKSDINRSYWKEVYEDNEILKDFTPSRVKVREVKISIPLAVENISDEKIIKRKTAQNCFDNTLIPL